MIEEVRGKGVCKPVRDDPCHVLTKFPPTAHDCP